MNFLKIILIIILAANQINAFTTGHMSTTAADHARSRSNSTSLHEKFFNRESFSKTYRLRKILVSKAALTALFQ